MAESAVNQVVSKRMVKKQQMRWTPRGAHLLLQVRTRINDDLAGDFAPLVLRLHTHARDDPRRSAGRRVTPTVRNALGALAAMTLVSKVAC